MSHVFVKSYITINTQINTRYNYLEESHHHPSTVFRTVRVLVPPDLTHWAFNKTNIIDGIGGKIL